MTEEEISVIARRFSSLELHKPDSSPNLLVAHRGDTLILLGFTEAQLETYQVSWTSGFKKQSSRLKNNLCSGAKYVELNLVVPSHLAGASIWLDGEHIGEVSKLGSFSGDIPLGIHALKLEKAGVGVWRAELRYSEASAGYDRLPFSSLTKQE